MIVHPRDTPPPLFAQPAEPPTRETPRPRTPAPSRGSCKCPHCGAKMVEYRHRLNRGLVTVMRRLHAAGGRAKLADLDLTNSQWDNSQKLSYFGLIEKTFIAGRRVRGMWEITDLGRRFLAGEASVRGVAVTYRGKVQSFEGGHVFVADIDPLTDYAQVRNYAAEATPPQGAAA